MRWSLRRFSFALALAAFASLLVTMVPASAADPVLIRIGAGPSADEQVWLMSSHPELTPNQGKVYKLEMTIFRAAGVRFVAYQAGQLDAATAATSATIYAASQGIDAKLVALETLDSPKYAPTAEYLTLTNSKFDKTHLKGATIGLSGFRTSFELFARAAIKRAGLNPDRDVKFVVVPLPDMGAALRSGKIDIGVLPIYYASSERAKGGLRMIVDSTQIAPDTPDAEAVYFSPDFIAKNRDAVRAWAQDFNAVTKYFVTHEREARQLLINAKLINVDPTFYLNLTKEQDSYHPPVCSPSAHQLHKMQELMIDTGFQKTRVDVDKLYDPTLCR